MVMMLIEIAHFSHGAVTSFLPSRWLSLLNMRCVFLWIGGIAAFGAGYFLAQLEKKDRRESKTIDPKSAVMTSEYSNPPPRKGPLWKPNEGIALIVVDVQQGFNDVNHWGGRRNNLDAEKNIAKLIKAFREARTIYEQFQKTGSGGYDPKAEGKEQGDEQVLTKTVNSSFIGTDLDKFLRSGGFTTVVICGITTNHCCETTTRMAGNLGFNTLFAADATCAFDRVSPSGKLYRAETIFDMTITNLNGEFATIVSADQVVQQLCS